MSNQKKDQELNTIFNDDDDDDDDDSIVKLMAETPDFTLIQKKEGEYNEGLMGNAYLQMCDTYSDLKYSILTSIKTSIF